MFRHKLEKRVKLSTAANWFMLSFLSGTVNAGGYLATHQFVTHVTGFATLFGIDVAHGEWDEAVAILSVPAFFLIGVIISAILVDLPHHLDRRPNYALVMALVGSFLLFAGIGGHYHLFGVFGSAVKLREDYILLVLLCGASGLQNAAITTASGATVRTTHLTGLTTDIGIGLVRAYGLAYRKNDAYRSELWANELRLLTLGSFIAGSVVGAVLFVKFKYLGFLLPSALAFFSMNQALRPLRRLRRILHLREATHDRKSRFRIVS